MKGLKATLIVIIVLFFFPLVVYAIGEVTPTPKAPSENTDIEYQYLFRSLVRNDNVHSGVVGDTDEWAGVSLGRAYNECHVAYVRLLKEPHSAVFNYNESNVIDFELQYSDSDLWEMFDLLISTRSILPSDVTSDFPPYKAVSSHGITIMSFVHSGDNQFVSHGIVFLIGPMVEYDDVSYFWVDIYDSYWNVPMNTLMVATDLKPFLDFIDDITAGDVSSDCTGTTDI